MDCINVSNLTKKYGKVIAVDDISFSIKKGSVTCILGPNGSGKSTTIKSICNLIIPEKGDIKILGKPNYKSIEKLAALFEGTRNLYWRLTPVENLRYFAGLRGLGGKIIDKKIYELLEFFNLSDKKNVLVNKLSRGMQQKVAIAMALVCDTDIIMLDEPTLGLDVESCIDVKNCLRDIAEKLNKTILLSTHDMSFAQDICDYAIILNKGKIVANDSMNNLLDMFKSKTYSISLYNKLTDKQKESIMNSSNDFYFNDEINNVEVDLINKGNIYDIINIFKNLDILIKEIKQSEVNFERIYLKLTKEENK